jgi:hypothetical protein
LGVRKRPPAFELEIYVMNADGSGQRNLTQSPLRAELGHTWSPALKK